MVDIRRVSGNLTFNYFVAHLVIFLCFNKKLPCMLQAARHVKNTTVKIPWRAYPTAIA